MVPFESSPHQWEFQDPTVEVYWVYCTFFRAHIVGIFLCHMTDQLPSWFCCATASRAKPRFFWLGLGKFERCVNEIKPKRYPNYRLGWCWLVRGLMSLAIFFWIPSGQSTIFCRAAFALPCVFLAPMMSQNQIHQFCKAALANPLGLRYFSTSMFKVNCLLFNMRKSLDVTLSALNL